MPDATTLLNFPHLLEAHALTGQNLTEVDAYLGEQRLLLREGTIVDATIIAAPSSKVIRSDLPVLTRTAASEETVVEEMAKRYAVSAQAMGIRLSYLGYIESW